MFYTTLFKALDTHNVDYLLIGGLAVNLYGVPRFTMDADLIVALNSKNIANLSNCIEALGLYPKGSIKLEYLVDDQKRYTLIIEKQIAAVTLLSQSLNAPEVKILIHHPLNVQEAFANCVTRDFSGTPITLASIEDMVILKKATGRAQDYSDINHLTQYSDKKTSEQVTLNSFSYYVSDEQLACYAAMNNFERLQWVEEARLFSLMTQTPESRASQDALRQVTFKEVFFI